MSRQRRPDTGQGLIGEQQAGRAQTNPADPEEFLPTGVYDGVLKFNDFETEKEVKIVYNKFYLRPAFIPSVIKRIIIDPYFLKYIFMYGWGLLRKTFDNT